MEREGIVDDDTAPGHSDGEDWTTQQVQETVRRLDAARLEEPLRTLPLRPPVKVPLGATAADAIRKMRDAGVGACLVEDRDGRLAGIFTERDLVNRVPLDGTKLDSVPIEELMRPDPDTLTPEHPVAYALNRMAGGGYRHVPLVDGRGRAVGLVTLRDIVEDLVQHFGDDVLSLPPTRRSAIAKEREGA